MKERFKQLYGNIVKQPVRFSTIHSFCNCVVKDYEKRQGNTSKRMDASGADSQQAVVKMLYSHMYHSKIEEDDLEKLIQAIGLLKTECCLILKNCLVMFRTFQWYTKHMKIINVKNFSWI